MTAAEAKRVTLLAVIKNNNQWNEYVKINNFIISSSRKGSWVILVEYPIHDCILNLLKHREFEINSINKNKHYISW